MGRDKATLPIDGVPQAERIVQQLAAANIRVTTLGRQPTPGAAFLADEEVQEGPLAALARFQPKAPWVFVASCDLPLFDAGLVGLLAQTIGVRQAAVPVVGGWRQPLCALYDASAWQTLSHIGGSCAMKWLDTLDARLVTEAEMRQHGLNPAIATGANTPEELGQALSAQEN